MASEQELKYRVDDLQLLDCLLCDPIVRQCMTEPFRFIRMNSTYFDLPDGSLSKKCWTLRVRQENERTVITCKTPLPDAGSIKARNEWECEAETLEDGLPKLAALGAPAELAALDPETLEPVCGVQFTRITALLQISESASCFICGDIGELLHTGRRAPLCELELELHDGTEQELLAYATKLNAIYHLKPEPLSKFARAKAL